MSRLLNVVLLVHLVVSVLLGALLLIVPGRLLGAVGWAPIDPLISRILGAALLAMAWGDWRVWRRATVAESRIWYEVQAAFAALAAIGVLRHVAFGWWPAMVWVLFAGLAAFALIWIWALIEQRR